MSGFIKAIIKAIVSKFMNTKVSDLVKNSPAASLELTDGFEISKNPTGSSPASKGAVLQQLLDLLAAQDPLTVNNIRVTRVDCNRSKLFADGTGFFADGATLLNPDGTCDFGTGISFAADGSVVTNGTIDARDGFKVSGVAGVTTNVTAGPNTLHFTGGILTSVT